MGMSRLRGPLAWLSEAPNHEEVTEAVLLGLLRFGGQVEEATLEQIDDMIGDMLTAAALLGLAAQGDVKCRMGDDGQIVWMKAEDPEPDLGVTPELEDSGEFATL